MENNKIKVEMNGGYLIAERNPDKDYDGITIYFETKEGDIIDVVLTECKNELDRKTIEVYCYENVFTEDFTRKYEIKT